MRGKKGRLDMVWRHNDVEGLLGNLGDTFGTLGLGECIEYCKADRSTRLWFGTIYLDANQGTSISLFEEMNLSIPNFLIPPIFPYPETQLRLCYR